MAVMHRLALCALLTPSPQSVHAESCFFNEPAHHYSSMHYMAARTCSATKVSDAADAASATERRVMVISHRCRMT